MAVKKIVKIWDGKKLLIDNINFLKTPTKEIKNPSIALNKSANIKNIIKDLVDTYKATSCAGIAANQIGHDKKIFIGMKTVDDDIDTEYIEELEARLSNDEDNAYPDNYEIYINPQIVSTNKKSIQNESEGCLSIPNLSIKILRYDEIKVRYCNQHGKIIKKKLTGFLSKLFQHESDHLEGNLMIESKNIADILILDQNEKIQKKYANLLNEYYIKYIQ